MSFRRDTLTKPIFALARGALPAMSDTEREALEAGDVWWDADLFTGNPDWSKLLSVAPATLTEEEQAFLNGPVNALCAMLDEWKIFGNGATCLTRSGISSSAKNSSA